MQAAVGEEEETLFTKTTIIKNLLVVATGTMLLLGSDDVLVTYQSTLNNEGGKGVFSVLVQYSFCVIASFFLPKYFVMRFGCKATMILAGLNFIPFFVSNYYPMYSLMIMSSFLNALGYALFLGAVDPYINDLAFLYDRDAGKLDRTHASLSANLKSDDIICTTYKNIDIDIIYPTYQEAVDKNICKIHQTINGFEKINTHQQNYLFGRECSTETIQSIRRHSCMNSDQNTTEITCNCIETRETCITLQTRGDNDTINICKSSLKSNDIETIFKYPSDIKEKSSTHLDIGDIGIKTSNPVNQTVYDGDNKKEQTQIFHISNCKNDTNSKSLETITDRFFGFHSMIYQLCYLWSSIISFFVLQSGFTQDSIIFSNETCLCGASYCNVETACSEYNLRQPTAEARISLISLCVGLCILACAVLFVLLDDLKPKDKSVSLSLDMLLATYRQMKRKDQILLAPFTMYIGMMKGFYLADFTKSYVGCAWGIQCTGLVTACAGATMVLTSSSSGWFVKYLGRLAIFVTAAVLNVALNVTLLLWVPDSNKPSMFFVTAGLWGALYGTFHTQVRAFHGVLFRTDEQAAFCVYLIWYCIGSSLTLGLSNFICNVVKIYLLMSISSLGVIGYLVVERSHRMMNT